LEKVKALTEINGEGAIISSACASSSAALGFASSLIRSGKHDCVLVVAAERSNGVCFFRIFLLLWRLTLIKLSHSIKNRARPELGRRGRFHFINERKKELKKKTGRSWVKWLVGLWQGTLII